MINRMRPAGKTDCPIALMLPGIPPYYQRYQIPLPIVPGVRFCIEDEEVYMEPGSAWWFDNQRLHAVFNNTDQDRISISTGTRPFRLDDD